jgi:hypothetical protein
MVEEKSDSYSKVLWAIFPGCRPTRTGRAAATAAQHHLNINIIDIIDNISYNIS